MKLHQDQTVAPVVRYALGEIDHVPVVEDQSLSLSLSLTHTFALGQKLRRRWVVRYALADFDHVPVIKDLAQVEAKINNLAAGAPRYSSKHLFWLVNSAKFCLFSKKIAKTKVAT